MRICIVLRYVLLFMLYDFLACHSEVHRVSSNLEELGLYGASDEVHRVSSNLEELGLYGASDEVHRVSSGRTGFVWCIGRLSLSFYYISAER
jgi:hypothetical protein